MTSIINKLHHGLRGIFYTIKIICSTTFILCLGFLIGVYAATFNNGMSETEIERFIAIFLFLVIASAILWIIFNALHKRWIAKHQTEIQREFLTGLKNDGIISEEILLRAIEKMP